MIYRRQSDRSPNGVLTLTLQPLLRQPIESLLVTKNRLDSMGQRRTNPVSEMAILRWTSSQVASL